MFRAFFLYLPSPKSKNPVMRSLERIMFALFWIIFWCVFLFSLPKLCKTSPFLICQPALFETPRHVRVHSGVVAASGAEGQRHRHQHQRRHQQGRRPHWWQMVAGNPPSLLGGWAPSEYSGYPGIQKTPLKQWVEHIYNHHMMNPKGLFSSSKLGKKHDFNGGVSAQGLVII